tara:strand:- start:5509 stop:8283 length:2775 start_codon:yes stop_codon:yes gene_type:complete
MKIKLILLTALMLGLSNAEVKGQCPDSNAKLYLNKVQAAKNWTPTERVNSGNKVQRWTQISAWYAYNCECNQSTYTVNGVTKTRTANQAEAIRNSMNAISQTIQSNYPNAEFKPVIRNSPCGYGTQTGASVGQINKKSSTHQKLMKSFANYNKAMGLKKQGENIAKAYAQQVKSYGELNSANSPEALLQNFNNNMQAIADLQTQNKADNLDQVTNTLNSSLNDLNSGNYEGAMFSALSLLDQAEAKRIARWEAATVKQDLIFQAEMQMTVFYQKALEINNQTIKHYYQKAAFAYSKEEETYLLEYIDNLECFKESMKNNLKLSSTTWTKNNCPIPVKKTHTVNNLIAKDIQYINAAKRKYALYEKTGEPIFQQGAMRFAGLAATENPKIEYYYLMGHFAGTNNPLVAYSSFITAESKNAKYFVGEKASEYSMIKMSLEVSLKKSIEENDQDIIKNIVGANLHQSVTIDGSFPIIYAIKIDQADVVYAFLNTELEGKPQSVITNKVQEVITMAAIMDAPNTIQKFVDLGFSIDFTIDGKTPLDIAEEALSIKSFNKISELLGGQTKYTFENSDAVKLQNLSSSADINDTLKVISTFHSLKTSKSKYKAIDLLLCAKKRDAFFIIYESNKGFYLNWVKENRTKIFKKFSEEVLYKNNKHIHRYLSPDLLPLTNGVNLADEDLATFYKIWIENSYTYISMFGEDWNRYTLPVASDPFIYNDHLARIKELIKRRDWTKKNIIRTDLKTGVISTGDFTDDWNWNERTIDGMPMIDYITASDDYKMNLLDFALYIRMDKNMVKVLLENNDSDTIVTDDVIGKVINYSKDGFALVLTQDKIDLVNMLIFDFNFDQNAFYYMLNSIIEHPREDMFPRQQSILDKLIQSGRGKNMDEWDQKRLLRKVKKNSSISKQNKKYLNAVISGNYDKRY